MTYTRPTDNIADSVTPTLTVGTADANYPIANLTDGIPSKPFKVTGTTLSVVWDFGSATNVDAVTIPMHNLDAALAGVRWQGNAANAWGAPSIDQALTVPADDADGLPGYVHLDLSAISPRAYRYWRLHIPTANSVAIALGECFIWATLRTLTRSFGWGTSESGQRIRVVQKRLTHGRKLTYKLGTRLDTVRGMVPATAANKTDLFELHRQASEPNACFLVSFLDVVRIMTWDQDDDIIEIVSRLIDEDDEAIELGFEEAPRGYLL